MWVYRATVQRVVDGDTVDVSVDLGFFVSVLVRVRLAEIDTPELNASDAAVRERARAARDHLVHLLAPGERVMIHTERDRREKFGRWLATISPDVVNSSSYLRAEVGDARTVNAAMVRDGFAVPYEGGARG